MSASFRGPCTARCAHTGRRCALPAHGAGDHANGRYRFSRSAAPDQTFFPGEAELAAAATARHGAESP